MKEKIILDSLINLYIIKQNPISSKELKDECKLPFSASTIRNYFQKLNENGFLVKEHISAGRIPSKKALVNYWIESLNNKSIRVDESKLKKASKIFDVYIAIENHLQLIEVINLNNRFVILDFEEEEIVFRYSDELFIFFTQLISFSLKDIKKIINNLKVDILVKKFDTISIKEFNKSFLYKHKLLKMEYRYGLNFYDKYLSLMTDFDNKKMLIVGDIYTDYNQLLDFIKEAG